MTEAGGRGGGGGGRVRTRGKWEGARGTVAMAALERHTDHPHFLHRNIKRDPLQEACVACIS